MQNLIFVDGNFKRHFVNFGNKKILASELRNCKMQNSSGSTLIYMDMEANEKNKKVGLIISTIPIYRQQFW